MTDDQLRAYGELLATMEHVLCGKLAMSVITKMISNPTDQAFGYWFVEAMKSADDADGLHLSALREAAGYDLTMLPPAKQGIVQIAYYKTKGERNISEERLRIGREVAKARRDAGLSIRKLAEICGVSPQNITKVENGKYNVSIDILSRLTAPLGKSITIS